MKKIFATILCMSLVACMTACGKDNGSESEPTTPAIKVYNEQLTTVTTTTEPPTEPITESEHAPLVPVIEQNVSDEIDLSLVAINGYEIDLDNLSYQSFLQMTQLHKGNGGVLLDTNLFYFNGDTHCLTDDGTQFFVELVDNDGNLVEDDEIEKYEPNELYVKGVHFSNFYTKGDYNISLNYAGIKCNMEKDLFISVMNGTGEQAFGGAVYQNSVYTMIVDFESKMTETGESVQVVSEITLLRN